MPLLLALFALQSLSAARTKSATWDEVNYFGMGDYLLRSGRWDVPSAVIHPPLAYYLDSIPILFADVDRTVWRYSPAIPRDLTFLGEVDAERGQALLASPANRNDNLLTLARLMVVLQALLLGFFVYRFARALQGWPAGILALAFFAFCPNMLAHGALVTPDMTVTAFFFITIYFFRLALVGCATAGVKSERPTSPRNFALAGLFLGLALLSKFTAVLLLPLEAIMLAVALVVDRKRVPIAWLAVSLACAALVFLAAYRFNPGPYLQGLAVQSAHGAEGHNGFLFGQLSRDGWWYYCLVAFALKTPIPLLLALLAALAIAVRDLVKKGVSLDVVSLWLPVIAVFVLFSIELRSIGLRYVLPVYPFVFVIVAVFMVRFLKLKRLWAAAVVWFAIGSAVAWPHYIAYFNESVGGADNAYRYLVDSNLDWGQDLKGLKQFMDSRGIDRIYLSYFGTDSPARYGIRYDWLPSYYLKNPNPQQTINLSRGRYLAISATNLQGVYMERQTMFRWLDRYRPVAQIGHSIFVYHLE